MDHPTAKFYNPKQIFITNIDTLPNKIQLNATHMKRSFEFVETSSRREIGIEEISKTEDRYGYDNTQSFSGKKSSITLSRFGLFYIAPPQ